MLTFRRLLLPQQWEEELLPLEHPPAEDPPPSHDDHHHHHAQPLSIKNRAEQPSGLVAEDPNLPHPRRGLQLSSSVV